MINTIIKRLSVVAAAGAFAFWLLAFAADGVRGFPLVILTLWWGAMFGTPIVAAGYVCCWLLGPIGKWGRRREGHYQILSD